MPNASTGFPCIPKKLCANLLSGGHSPRMRQPPPPLRISHAAAVILIIEQGSAELRLVRARLANHWPAEWHLP